MQILNLFIDQSVSGNSVVESIRKRVHAPCKIVNGPENIYEMILKSDDPLGFAKRILFLNRNKGTFIRECPGTNNYICCNYKILHIATYCSMDCAYCILQSYFHPPLLQFFVNHDDMFNAMEMIFSQKNVTRIGTGEYTDSLIWETIYPLSEKLILKFASQSHAVLELKTKTNHVEHLLKLPHNRKTILSWSLNTDSVIKKSERGTASLLSRILAASKCDQNEYPLAFHFDPLIIYPGCEEDYQDVIKLLFKHISSDNIVWISLGSFRFMPGLKPIIEKRFLNSMIVYGEFIKGVDDKMRYFKPLRIQLYKKIISAIRSYAPNTLIYFCMEDDEVWRKAIGFSPAEVGGLPLLLDSRAARHCSLAENFR